MDNFLAVILIIVCIATCSNLDDVSDAIREGNRNKRYELYEKMVDTLGEQNQILIKESNYE